MKYLANPQRAVHALPKLSIRPMHGRTHLSLAVCNGAMSCGEKARILHATISDVAACSPSITHGCTEYHLGSMEARPRTAKATAHWKLPPATFQDRCATCYMFVVACTHLPASSDALSAAIDFSARRHVCRPLQCSRHTGTPPCASNEPETKPDYKQQCRRCIRNRRCACALVVGGHARFCGWEVPCCPPLPHHLQLVAQTCT